MRSIVVFAACVVVCMGVPCFTNGTQGNATVVSPSPSPVPNFDINRDLMDPAAEATTKVSCCFCNESLTVLLEQCKIHNARSAANVADFLMRCTQIGGLEPSKMDLMATECSDSTYKNLRVNFIYQRRLRCSKIYRTLLELYDPYDPCLQIRTDYQTNPMSVCRSGGIDCVLPPPNATAVIQESAYQPYKFNGSIVFHLPPLSCDQYLSDAVAACANIKKFDFYAKSNLAGWCNNKYSEPFQAMGCENVVNSVYARDYFMDMCNGLTLFPMGPKERLQTCVDKFHISAYEPVMVLAYHKYLAYIHKAGKDKDYARLLNTTHVIGPDQIVLLPQ